MGNHWIFIKPYYSLGKPMISSLFQHYFNTISTLNVHHKKHYIRRICSFQHYFNTISTLFQHSKTIVFLRKTMYFQFLEVSARLGRQRRALKAIGIPQENNTFPIIARELHGKSLDFHKTLLFLRKTNDFTTVSTLFQHYFNTQCAP